MSLPRPKPPPNNPNFSSAALYRQLTRLECWRCGHYYPSNQRRCPLCKARTQDEDYAGRKSNDRW